LQLLPLPLLHPLTLCPSSIAQITILYTAPTAIRALHAKGDLPTDTTGAWAGEIGMVQMLPADILARGVDGDGDGHVTLKTLEAEAPVGAEAPVEAEVRAMWATSYLTLKIKR